MAGASHCSSSPRQVENWIGGASKVLPPHLFNRHIPTNQPGSRSWALACRLRQGDLERLSLRATGRIRASFVSDPGHQVVCPACLDEDAEEGRYHYCRRPWACGGSGLPKAQDWPRDELGGCFPHGAVSIFHRSVFIVALWSTAVSHSRHGSAYQPSTGMASRDHDGHCRPPVSGCLLDGMTGSLCSRSLSVIRPWAGPSVSSSASSNAGRFSPKSPCGNRIPAARSRHC